MSELRGVSARAWSGRRALSGALFGLFMWTGLAGAQEGTAGYRVQVGAQERQADATALQGKVTSEVGTVHGVYVVRAGGFYKVRIGDFVTRAEAASLLAQVRALGYGDAWVTADQVRLGSAAGGGGQPGRRPDAAAPAAPTQPTTPASTAAANSIVSVLQDRTVTPAPVTERTSTAPPTQPARTGDQRPPASEANPPVEAEVFPAPRPQPPAEESATDRTARVTPRTSEAEAAWPRVDDGAIRLDGSPTEAAWDRAGSGWAQRPSAASGSAPGTSVQFAYDASAFYVATRVNHSRAGALAEAADQAPGDQERVVVTIRRNGMVASSFGVTLNGVRIRYEDAWRQGGDTDWQAKTATAGNEWSSEIRVPYELLGVDEEAAGDAWEVSVRWEDPKGAMPSSSRDLPIEQFAQVFDFWDGGTTRFAVAPFYQASTAVATASPSWDTPASRFGGRIEADVGTALKARAEIQPDYLDVRPDPATVNLSPFETRFREHRPFFRDLESDQNAWAPGWGPSLFYSRRVGAVPGSSVLTSG
ncbi:MAG: SPOR domain-containing protein, partial [Gemmatimonadota bacterium]|nr:SPOR domain-containing protein [Gemmatimonadota bacterium]